VKQPISLPITSANNRPLSNLFFTSDHPNGWLALMLPGLNYTADMPLLYYSKMLLMNRGVDVLQLMPETMSVKFQALDAENRKNWLRSDMLAGLQAGLEQSNYRALILVGKSIGSLGMALALPTAQSRLPTCAVWLTPLFREAVVMDAAFACEGPSFFLCGGADGTYQEEKLDSILKFNTKAIARVIAGADHSLELTGDEEATFQALREGMQAMERFLDEILI
jgi:hypothetical protein